jgi:hypothetical protein
MKYRKGMSGNPKGRPIGLPDRRNLYRDHLQQHAPALVQKVIELALAGDVGALRLCLERVCPALRPKDEQVRLGELKGTLTEQGQVVLSAIGAAQLTPAEGASLLQGLAAQAKLVETDDLARRVQALESINAKKP